MNTDKHVCPLCDYVYEDTRGEPFLGIAPGTLFADLPETWRHPDCTGSVEMFETCTCVSYQAVPDQELLLQPVRAA